MADFPIAVITDEFTQDMEMMCRTAVELGIPGLEVRTVWNKLDTAKSLAGKGRFKASYRTTTLLNRPRKDRPIGRSSPVNRATAPRSLVRGRLARRLRSGL